MAYDYIVIGAGSAGCVLANRLSADPANRVLLLEAGGRDINPWIHIPVGYFKTMHNPATDWCYVTEPDKGINNRKLQWPRGKVLGGSSSLNGLLYVRGQAEDYDDWAKQGNPGWAYKDVLPYFLRSEDQENGASTYHGVGGPLKVSSLRLRRQIAEYFIQGAQEYGIPINDDYNGADQEGVGYFQQTAWKGLRWSTAKGFLKPALKRPNLHLRINSQVTKLVFSGNRVTAVRFVDKDKQRHQDTATREVLLCCGAVGSPQILQLSGIGDSEHLKKLGIQPLSHLPGVGRNLQDHLQIRLVYKTSQRTLNDELNNLLKRTMVGLQYFLTRTGPLTLAASQVTVFTRSNPGVERPDIQFHIQPLSADKPGDGVHPFSAFTASVCQLRPMSRGRIDIVSANPATYPQIQPNYLSHPTDCQVAIDSIKVARGIAATAALGAHITSEYVPGAAYQSDEELLYAARQFSQTIYHPVGTCKMGKDQDAVVDHQLRVHELDGLRVVDASIMPTITSGNTNAPTIMIAEKAADMILADK